MFDFSYTIIKSKRRTLCIQIKGAEVIVRAPKVCKLSTIEKFLREKENWITKKLLQANAQKEQANRCSNGKVIFDGRVISLPLEWKSEEEFYSNLLISTEEEFSKIAKQNGLNYRSLRFGRGKSYWGTCSVNNEIRLNRAVSLLPKKLREYVFLHELSHTIYHNHSPKFWCLLEKIYPECKSARKELKNYTWILTIGGKN